MNLCVYTRNETRSPEKKFFLDSSHDQYVECFTDDLGHRACTCMTLVVPSLFGCVFPTILDVSLYIPLCMYHVTKRDIMCVFF
jgi:hypothetical protein